MNQCYDLNSHTTITFSKIVSDVNFEGVVYNFIHKNKWINIDEKNVNEIFDFNYLLPNPNLY